MVNSTDSFQFLQNLQTSEERENEQGENIYTRVFRVSVECLTQGNGAGFHLKGREERSIVYTKNVKSLPERLAFEIKVVSPSNTQGRKFPGRRKSQSIGMGME